MVLVRSLLRFLNITTASACTPISFHSNDFLQIIIQEQSSVPKFLIVCQPSCTYFHQTIEMAMPNKKGMSYFPIKNLPLVSSY